MPMFDGNLGDFSEPPKPQPAATFNIPPAVRFALYNLGAGGGIFVIYAIQKGWAGDAEYQLWTGFAALLTMLAASKTSLSDAPKPPEDEAGYGALETVILGLFALILLFVLLSVAGLR